MLECLECELQGTQDEFLFIEDDFACPRCGGGGGVVPVE